MVRYSAAARCRGAMFLRWWKRFLAWLCRLLGRDKLDRPGPVDNVTVEVIDEEN